MAVDLDLDLERWREGMEERIGWGFEVMCESVREGVKL